jgi:crotonobetaine/carnitine-CoA ligase
VSFVVPDRDRWTLPGLLRERAAEHGERAFLSFASDDAQITYAEADERSDRLAAGLSALGVRRGGSVLLMLGNRLEFVLTWFALSKLGAPHVPVNVDYRGEFLEHLANTSQARLIVLESRFLDTLAGSLPRLPRLRSVVTVGEAAQAPAGVELRSFAELPLDAAPPDESIGPADTGSIMFTSGTTGRSKGALMPHASMHLLCERNGELLGMDEHSVYSSELPLFHINAQMTVYGALLAGARARLEERFSASRWLERIRACGATHTSMLGVMVDFVLAQPEAAGDREHELRSVWTVPCVPQSVERFRERFGIERLVTSYGTTEVGMVANRVVEPLAPASAGPVGRDLYDVTIADPETDEPVRSGESGEILVRSRLPWTITSGYFGMPDRTASATRNLWFHTGDLGRFDEHGNLCFLDRLQDRIRRRGENVASADVEQVLGSHPAVAEAAVVAVAADEKGGEDEIKACLVLGGSAAPFDAGGFWDWCDERLPYFAVPRYLELRERLPKTPTEKVIKHELRDSAGGRLFDRGPAGLRARR